MRSSMLFASLILLLSRVHGRPDMQLHGVLNKKVSTEYRQQEEMPSDLKLQRPPPADALRRASERHLRSTARAGSEENGEVKKTRSHRDVAPRLIHEDYAGPSGHSPNHHRTIRCGPC